MVSELWMKKDVLHCGIDDFSTAVVGFFGN
jgi:hypothetical protein